MLYEIYFSPTGGTKKTADIICGAWADERKEVDLTERDLEMDEMSFDSEDICIIAVPSFGGRYHLLQRDSVPQQPFPT